MNFLQIGQQPFFKSEVEFINAIRSPEGVDMLTGYKDGKLQSHSFEERYFAHRLRGMVYAWVLTGLGFVGMQLHWTEFDTQYINILSACITITGVQWLLPSIRLRYAFRRIIKKVLEGNSPEAFEYGFARITYWTSKADERSDVMARVNLQILSKDIPNFFLAAVVAEGLTAQFCAESSGELQQLARQVKAQSCLERALGYI